VSDLRAAIADVRGDGRSRNVRCPAHEDNRASLSIGRGTDGRVVVKCHAGCETETVLSAAGLAWSDLHEPRNGHPNDREIVATYDYADENGALVYQACRFSPKDFRQRRPNGVGGWIWNLHDTRRVLFGLPELKAQSVIYIPEGEKDVLALRKIGLTATTSAGGASKNPDKPKWRNDYTQQLRSAGAEFVVVLPDNDDPGRAHAEAVARSCYGGGLKVKVVALPELPEKGDVSDWLDAGHTRDELITIVKASPLYVPRQEVSSNGDLSDAPVIQTLSTVKRESVRWIWPRRLARGKLALIAGEPGEGKSTLVLDLGARISTGAAWPDGGHAPLGDVLILSAEDGLADTIAPRLDASGADSTRIHALTAIQSRGGARRHLDLGRDLPQLEAAIQRIRPVVVGIDPISAYLGKADTWKDSEVRALLAPIAELAENYNCAILGVMHLSKGRERKALHRAMGSIGFVAAARIVLAVARDPDNDERRLLLPVKNNLSPPADALAFRLDSGRVLWESGPVHGLTADSVLSASTCDREDRQDAEQLIRGLLDDENWPLDAAIALKAGRAHGVHERTMQRTAQRLGIRIRRIGFGRGGRWVWYKPGIADTIDDNSPNTHSVSSMSPMSSMTAPIDDNSIPDKPKDDIQIHSVVYDEAIADDGRV
jgi:putative DNA primase/helicase